MNNFANLILDENYNAVLRLLLSVSAITVPLFLAFVVQRFILFRQQQFDKVQPLGELQDELRLYRQAISAFASDLFSMGRRNGVDVIKFGRDFFEQRKNIDFWTKEEHASAIYYISAFDYFGREYYYQPIYSKGGGIIPPEQFELLFEALEQGSSMFARAKYYRPVFASLGIEVNAYGSHQTTICTDRVRFQIPKELEKEEMPCTSFGYWDRITEEAYNLMEKMQPFYDNLFFLRFPRKMLVYSFILALFGIFVPLTILSLKIPRTVEFYSTYTAVALFSIFLTLNLYQVWAYLSSPLFRFHPPKEISAVRRTLNKLLDRLPKKTPAP